MECLVNALFPMQIFPYLSQFRTGARHGRQQDAQRAIDLSTDPPQTHNHLPTCPPATHTMKHTSCQSTSRVQATCPCLIFIVACTHTHIHAHTTRLQFCNDGADFFCGQDTELLRIRRNHRNLNIDLTQLLLHGLFQDGDAKLRGLIKFHRLVVLLLQNSLCPFRTRSDRLRLILDVCSRGVRVPQSRALLINSSNQQTDSERSTHFLLLFATLPESEGQVAHGKGAALHSHGFVVCKPVILRLNPCMFHKGSSICRQAAHNATDMAIDLHDLFD
mmetsp:Transcript_88241/g.146677  ORF Transcript_88241/g.146677 Transcript_88241/m.146677 type:complete len:275 (-) Transcript_88241:222-1046(-)